MKLYYAIGGGLGHITRAFAFLNTTKQNPNDFIIVAYSKFIPYLPEQYTIIQPPKNTENQPKLLQLWLYHLILGKKIKEIFIDTFPTGIFGEWNSFPAMEKLRFFYVARSLKWEIYKPVIQNTAPNFQMTYKVETLPKEQQVFIEKNSWKSIPISLQFPELGNSDKKIFGNTHNKEIWIIVHSGIEEEVLALVEYAKDLANYENISPAVFLFSLEEFNRIPQYVKLIKHYPAWPYFKYAHKIFTAAGFNSIMQTSALKNKHHVLPFHRKFDDQFARAANRKKQMAP